MPKISELAYAGELGAANYILGVRDGVAVRFPIEVFEDEPIVNSSFTVLTDTPANYVDQAGKLAAVNSTETGLEFVDPPEGEYAFTDLTDTPNTYTDQGGKLVKVNSGGTGLEFGDAPASSFVGLSDTPASYTGNPGKVVAVKSDSSGLEFVSVSAGSYTIVDLSSATVDYALAPGEVAKITYSSATSVPLHIATAEGEYELKLSAAPVLTTCTDGAGYLNPNNTTYSNAIKRQYANGNSSTMTAGLVTESGFLANAHRMIAAKLHITTLTSGKHVLGQLGFVNNAGVYSAQTYTSIWVDTTTVWSSLGTITFVNAQSGTITVRRII